ncbi:hypothetical protein [Tersicoccus sp. Bi-70]|nr:hypothetical protein [Tersicoccus sp. Bi-70]
MTHQCTAECWGHPLRDGTKNSPEREPLVARAAADARRNSHH